MNGGNIAPNVETPINKTLVLLPLWTSHMSSQIIIIFDLGNILITQGFEESKTLLKMWLFFNMDLTTL